MKEDPVTGYTSSVAGTTDDSSGKTVYTYTVTNTLSQEKTGALKISKTVAATTSKEFKFHITLKKGDGEASKAVQGSFKLNSGEGKGTKTGTIYFDETGEAVISLKDGESAYIEGLPEEALYTVSETAYSGWEPELLDGTKWTGTISADTVAEVKVQNNLQHNLTVTNKVQGNMGNKAKEFTFTLTLTPPSGKKTLDRLTYVKNGQEDTLTAENGVFTFKLGHQESIELKGIPDGSSYRITEDGESEGYTVSRDRQDGTLKEDTTVTFLNTKNGSVPTLADMNTMIPLILVVLAAVGIGYIVWKRKKAKSA